MKKIGIVGAAGYTGEELLRILSGHAGVEVVFATSERLHGTPVTLEFPNLQTFTGLNFCAAEESLQKNVDLVFVCLHAGESVKWANR